MYAELNHLLVGSGQIPLNIKLKQDNYIVCCIHSVVSSEQTQTVCLTNLNQNNLPLYCLN